MIVQLLSDTHGNLSAVEINENADLIIHCGDLAKHYGTIKPILDFKELCDNHSKKHLIVLGNHDYYGFEYRKGLLDYLEQKGVNVLYTGKKYIHDGICFVGDTLFSGFNLGEYPEKEVMECAAFYINDFKGYIINEDGSDFSVEDCKMNHAIQLEWINQFRGKENTVILSHFPPSPICIDKKYDGDLLNGYFINNIDLTGFKMWFCGHTHRTFRGAANGCKVFINASGYARDNYRECPDFDPNFLVTI